MRESISRNAPEYTYSGLLDLGEAVRYFRQHPKPYWTPYVSDGLTPDELYAEIHEGWGIAQLADIINREFQLSKPIDYNDIRSLERPAASRKVPNDQLLIWIASLEIMRSPDGLIYTDQDLRRIAQGCLDWRTGELRPCCSSDADRPQ